MDMRLPSVLFNHVRVNSPQLAAGLFILETSSVSSGVSGWTLFKITANCRASQLPDVLTETVVLNIPGLANRREDQPCDT
jgi:hypothetical protein